MAKQKKRRGEASTVPGDNPCLPYERLQSALEVIQSLIQEPKAHCTLLGRRRDEGLLVATIDGYLGLAQTLLEFVLKVKCDLGPLADVERQEFEELPQRTYLASCDINQCFAGMSPYRDFVILVCAYLAEDEQSRRELEAFFEKIGE